MLELSIEIVGGITGKFYILFEEVQVLILVLHFVFIRCSPIVTDNELTDVIF